MIIETLHELIAGGERLDVEFKGEERQPLSDGDLVEAGVCLANRPGDHLSWLLGRGRGRRAHHQSVARGNLACLLTAGR